MVRRFLFHFLLVALAASVSPLAAFRPVNPQETAKREVEASEASFEVRSHLELYRYSRIDREGYAVSGRMLMTYAYSETEVQGCFRLLPQLDDPGVTLLYRQLLADGSPELWLHDPAAGVSGKLAPNLWWGRLGDTDWRCWMILDEDKSPWRYLGVSPQVFRGNPVNVVQARYDDEALARMTGVRGRRLYLGRQTDLFYAVEYLNRQDQPLTVLEAFDHQQYEVDGRMQKRPRRLVLHNLEDQSITVLVRAQSRFNDNLPEALFAPENLTTWAESFDEALLERLAAK